MDEREKRERRAEDIRLNCGEKNPPTGGSARRLVDLYERYDLQQLRAFPGDEKIRHDALRPFFENLHEGRLIYHERFTALVEVVEMDLTERGFQLNLRTVTVIKRWDHGTFDGAPDQWRVGNRWDLCCLGACGHKFTNRYVGFLLWPEAELVAEVEELMERSDQEGIERLLWRR